jgi:hypothetical protein
MSDRARRIAENEQRFRIFNDQVRTVRTQLDADADFACECGDPQCAERIHLSIDDYIHLRQDPRWFAVLPEHQRPDVERVIQRHPGYWIVQKTGEGAEIVQ